MPKRKISSAILILGTDSLIIDYFKMLMLVFLASSDHGSLLQLSDIEEATNSKSNSPQASQDDDREELHWQRVVMARAKLTPAIKIVEPNKAAKAAPSSDTLARIQARM